MKRFAGTVHRLAECPGWQAAADWIGAIDFEDWPQQNRLPDGKLRPAMVTDLGWHSFGAATEPLVQYVARLLAAVPSRRFLSAVMPGAGIDPHRDGQGLPWVARVHIPLLSNSGARFDCGGERFCLDVGVAYLVNTEVEHSVRNDGTTPRVHLMVDYEEG